MKVDTVIVAGPIQQVGLGERVAETLRHMIVARDLKPGDRLVEGALADQFAVSRGPIRDALKELETEGLIESSRRGAFVIGLTETDIGELYSLRETIEQFAVSLLIDETDTVDWTLLEGQVTAMHNAAEAGDVEAFSRADIQFHSLVYELAGHRRLQDVWRSYEKTFSVVLEHSGRQGLDLHRGADDHTELLRIFQSGDRDASRAILQRHLHDAHERLKQFLSA